MIWLVLQAWNIILWSEFIKIFSGIEKVAFEPYNGFSVGETPGIGMQLGKLLTGDYRNIMDLTFSFDHLETLKVRLMTIATI